MTITTVAQWRADGAPYKDAQPIAELRGAIVDRHGQDVVDAHELGTKGDKRHEEARPPEDHTAFSATGWPIRSPYPFGHALDWDGPGFRPQFRFWIAEKQRGRAPWLKYVNLDGQHYSFQPSRSVRPSSDWKGHGHVSVRSDWTHRSLAHGWKTLRRGSTGAGVKALQQIITLHTQFPNLGDDGIFGPKTEHAVKVVQALRGLPRADGIATADVRIALYVL